MPHRLALLALLVGCAPFGEEVDKPTDTTDSGSPAPDTGEPSDTADSGLAPAWSASTRTVTVPVDAPRLVDVVVLLDTSAATAPAPTELSFTDLATNLSELDADVQIGFATYDDYAFAPYGISGTDKPFWLAQQVTDDPVALEAALAATTIHGGGDPPEATLEALYQVLSSTGYDQDCNGVYDASADVLPFHASATDPFGGVAGEGFSGSSSGGGPLGGVGFREGALPIVVYATDGELRDPDAGYGSPDGCLEDAGASSVAEAAQALGAAIIGVHVDAGVLPQMEALATAAGSFVDLDGDGAADDPAVYLYPFRDFTGLVSEAVHAMVEARRTPRIVSEVTVTAEADPDVLDVSFTPTQLSDVDLDTLSTLDVTLTLVPRTDPADGPVSGTVTITLHGDGVVLGTATEPLELVPG